MGMLKKWLSYDPFLSVLTLTVLAARLLLLAWVICANPLYPDLFTFPDSAHYLVPAQTLLQHGKLLEAYTFDPLTFRTPGYPVFLAFLFLFSRSAAWIGLIQLLLTTVLIPLTYYAARLWLPRRAARAAAVLCACSGGLLAYSFAFLSDVLVAFCLTGFLIFALYYVKTRCLPALAAASCALTVSIFVRPVAYNVFYIGLVLLVLFTWKQGLRALFKTAIVFAAPLLLGTGAWTLRNYNQAGYAHFHSSEAYNLYFWNLDAYAAERGLPAQRGSDLLLAALPDGFTTWPLATRDQWLHERGVAMIKKYWPHKLKHAPFWLAKTLLGGSYTQLSRILFARPELSPEEFSYQLNKTTVLPSRHLLNPADKTLFALCLLQTLLTAVLACIGAWWGWKHKRREVILLVLFCGYFWGISSLFFGAGGRYRLPFETALCLLGGAGVQGVLVLVRRMQQHRLHTQG